MRLGARMRPLQPPQPQCAAPGGPGQLVVTGWRRSHLGRAPQGAGRAAAGGGPGLQLRERACRWGCAQLGAGRARGSGWRRDRVCRKRGRVGARAAAPTHTASLAAGRFARGRALAPPAAARASHRAAGGLGGAGAGPGGGALVPNRRQGWRRGGQGPGGQRHTAPGAWGAAWAAGRDSVRGQGCRGALGRRTCADVAGAAAAAGPPQPIEAQAGPPIRCPSHCVGLPGIQKQAWGPAGPTPRTGRHRGGTVAAASPGRRVNGAATAPARRATPAELAHHLPRRPALFCVPTTCWCARTLHRRARQPTVPLQRICLNASASGPCTHRTRASHGPPQHAPTCPPPAPSLRPSVRPLNTRVPALTPAPA